MPWTIEDLEDIVDYKCDDVHTQLFVHEITEEEIKRVLFSMPKEKSHGPDGYRLNSTKKWSVVGHDLMMAVQSFFRYGFYLKGLTRLF